MLSVHDAVVGHRQRHLHADAEALPLRPRGDEGVVGVAEPQRDVGDRGVLRQRVVRTPARGDREMRFDDVIHVTQGNRVALLAVPLDEERVTVKDVVRLASRIAGFSVVATARTSAAKPDDDWLPGEAVSAFGGETTVFIEELTENDLQELRATEPRLRPLLADTHPAKTEINAINDAGIQPEQVDYINAHGTSTPPNDRIETQAIKRLFGDHARKLAISSTKSMIGHLLGAAGAVEAGITSLVVERGIIPPTINYETPDPDCDLDYVPNKMRKADVRYALSNSFGFGGTNAALLFKRYEQ